VSVIEISYYTDPCCPWSWALEPALRRLGHEFGSSLRFTYVMSGMAREFRGAQQLVGESL
jgi:predicted DsbA family dithiol-disulfide isomerase